MRSAIKVQVFLESPASSSRKLERFTSEISRSDCSRRHYYCSRSESREETVALHSLPRCLALVSALVRDIRESLSFRQACLCVVPIHENSARLHRGKCLRKGGLPPRRASLISKALRGHLSPRIRGEARLLVDSSQFRWPVFVTSRNVRRPGSRTGSQMHRNERAFCR